jgi:hypothetical protein
MATDRNPYPTQSPPRFANQPPPKSPEPNAGLKRQIEIAEQKIAGKNLNE